MAQIVFDFIKTTISSNVISLFENIIIFTNTFYDLFHHMYMSPNSHMKYDFLSSLIDKKLWKLNFFSKKSSQQIITEAF